jgi:LacI family transcriptional regulator
MATHITLRDIARQTGYHFTTIGMALRGHPDIPPATAETIRKAARKMGYRLNPLLSAWMANVRQRRRKETTGETIAWLHYWSLSSCHWYHGAKQRAKELGFTLRPFWLGDPRLTNKRIDHILRSSGIRGLIVAPCFAPHDELSIDLDRLATVLIGHSVEKPQLHRVAHNQTHGMQLALRCARERGFTRIGLVISGDMDERTNNNYTAFYRHHEHCQPRASRIPLFLKNTEADYRNLRNWQSRHRVDCILGFHNMVPEIRAHLDENIPVFDLDLGINSQPGASGINQNPSRQGAVAVDLVTTDLLHNRTGLPSTPLTVLIEGEWVDGQK